MLFGLLMDIYIGINIYRFIERGFVKRKEEMTMDSVNSGLYSKTCKGNGFIKLFGVQIDVNFSEEDESIRKTNEEETVESIRKSNEEAVESIRRSNEEAVESIRRSNEEAVESIRKSKSMGNLQLACSSEQRETVDSGYLSDGLIQSKKAKIAHDQRKRGVAWTEYEHKLFLIGLKNLGKGDWRGISKKYVTSRTPTQVASHAQKYFIRKTTFERKKRRSSVFDLPFIENGLVNLQPPPPEANLAMPTDQASEITPEVSESQIVLSKNTTESEGQTSTSTHVLTADKPPLSPATRPYGGQIAHFYPMTPSYMVGVPSNILNLRPSEAMFVPLVMNYNNNGQVMMNYTDGGCVQPNHISNNMMNNINGNYVACGPFIPWPPSTPLPPGPPPYNHRQSPSPADPLAPASGKASALDVNIGALLI